MRKETTTLDYGIIEERFYDQDDKLVDIRKIYPSDAPVKSNAWVKRSPGSSGGHEF